MPCIYMQYVTMHVVIYSIHYNCMYCMYDCDSTCTVQLATYMCMHFLQDIHACTCSYHAIYSINYFVCNEFFFACNKCACKEQLMHALDGQ